MIPELIPIESGSLILGIILLALAGFHFFQTFYKYYKLQIFKTIDRISLGMGIVCLIMGVFLLLIYMTVRG